MTRSPDCRRALGELPGNCCTALCGRVYAREGGPVRTEDDQLDRNPPAGIRNRFEAIRYLEQTLPKPPAMIRLALFALCVCVSPAASPQPGVPFTISPAVRLSDPGSRTRSLTSRVIPKTAAGLWRRPFTSQENERLSSKPMPARTAAEPGRFRLCLSCGNCWPARK